MSVLDREFDLDGIGSHEGEDCERYYRGMTIPPCGGKGWIMRIVDLIDGHTKSGKKHLQVVYEPAQEIHGWNDGYYGIERFFVYDEHGNDMPDKLLNGRDPYYFLKMLLTACDVKVPSKLKGKEVRLIVVPSQSNPSYTNIVGHIKVKRLAKKEDKSKALPADGTPPSFVGVDGEEIPF